MLGSLAHLPVSAADQAGGPAAGAASIARAAAPAAPPPIPPATVSRSEEGAITVRAVRITEPLRLDGRLDETIYGEVPAIGNFIQQEPREGEPATEKTDTWILFDDRNVYVSARCWDSEPGRAVADEMRRDAQGILNNENFTVMFDTFHDKRNGVSFQINSLGGLRDALITDETDANIDWNGVWDGRTSTFDGGWTVEMVIPFKTLRYPAGTEQTWGVNMRRIVRWKNEFSSLMGLPAFLGVPALDHISFGATLVGLEVPPASLNLEVKPYGISGLRTDVNARPALENQRTSDWGLDVKYGLTKSLTLDLTYNTDFAQVEDDTQQVNLTRFNLFFPERREFFLEGRGIFAFGGTSTTSGGNAPILFFSRRIGLQTVGSTASVVPIVGGARVTGKAGRYQLGFLNIQADDDATSGARATNFTVARVKRDVFRRSFVGAMYTRRQETVSSAAPAGETYGVDTLVSTSPSHWMNFAWSETREAGVSSGPRFFDNASYVANWDYQTDRWWFQIHELGAGPNFDPQVGFVRRTDFIRHYLYARFSPRPDRRHFRAVRRFLYTISYEHVTNTEWRKDFTEWLGTFGLELQNGDRFTVSGTTEYEFIPRPFTIDSRSNTVIPVGGYGFQTGSISYGLAPQRPLSGTVRYQFGSLYDGNRHTVDMSSGRIQVSGRLAVEPTFSLNWVDVPWGSFSTTVVATRTTFTVSPRMFVSSLAQYSSGARLVSTNTRFRWEYMPGSELFVVYSDGHDTELKSGSGFSLLTNRAFVVKLNKLLRF